MNPITFQCLVRHPFQTKEPTAVRFVAKSSSESALVEPEYVSSPTF